MKSMSLSTSAKLIGAGAVIIAAVAGCGKKDTDETPAADSNVANSATAPAGAPAKPAAPGAPAPKPAP